MQTLWSVKDVTLELAKGILTSADRLYVNADDEDCVFSVSSFRGERSYQLHEYNVKSNPSALL